MTKVIALKGRSNIGKTSTLKELIKLLTEKYNPSNEDYLIDGADVRVIYTINGKKVGIETQGDPYSRLPKSLNLFKNENCQLIICACRSSGATVEAVKSLKPKYILSFRGQSSVSLEKWRDKSNMQIAKLILEEAEEILNI